MSVSVLRPDSGEDTLDLAHRDHPILFYDGACAFCNRAVQFVLRHDTVERFRFAALQSDCAGRTLARYGRDPLDLDTVYLLRHAGTSSEQLLARSDAGLAVLHELGGRWKPLAVIIGLVPRALRDRAYAFVVRHRYEWFGRYDQCPLPPPRVRERFIG